MDRLFALPQLHSFAIKQFSQCRIFRNAFQILQLPQTTLRPGLLHMYASVRHLCPWKQRFWSLLYELVILMFDVDGLEVVFGRLISDWRLIPYPVGSDHIFQILPHWSLRITSAASQMPSSACASELGGSESVQLLLKRYFELFYIARVTCRYWAFVKLPFLIWERTSKLGTYISLLIDRWHRYGL